MGHFDAEKQRAAKIAAFYQKAMNKVTQNTQLSTVTLRAVIAKVEKHEAKLAEIARVSADRLKYLDDVEKNVEMLANVAYKADRLSEEEAVAAMKGKNYGRLVDHSYNPSKPVKPQLVEALKKALASEFKRGHDLLAAQEQSFEAWDKSAAKHVAYCEKARAAAPTEELG